MRRLHKELTPQGAVGFLGQGINAFGSGCFLVCGGWGGSRTCTVSTPLGAVEVVACLETNASGSGWFLGLGNQCLWELLILFELRGS